MSGSGDNVIRTFNERLAVEQGVRALGAAPNAYELERRARELSAQGDAALAALLRQLDTDNPTLRGGLGLLAQHLDQTLVSLALRQAAADPRRPAAARLTAVMILERYLEETIDANLARILPEPADVARQSAEEALMLAASSPLVPVEYAHQLLDEPPEVVHAVLDVVAGLETHQRARLLHAIAAYGSDDVVGRILPWLGGIRHPLALESLRTLRHLVSDDMRPLAERQVRKLQMAGVRSEMQAPARALWSPLSAQGQSLLWFLCPREETQADLLILVLHDRMGIVHVDAEPSVLISGLPMPAPRGHVHRLRLPGSHQVVRLLEMEVALAMALVGEAVAAGRMLEIPWPAELVVFATWLWGVEPVGGEHGAAWPLLPEPDEQAQDAAFDELLRHLAFASWSWELPDFPQLLSLSPAGVHLEPGGPAHQQVARRLARGEAAQLLADRLERQARWLCLADDRETASLALAARRALTSGQVEHPFVRALAWRSLLTAAADRAAQQALRIAGQAHADAGRQTPGDTPEPTSSSF